jgi:hypothetical protein
MGNFGMVAEGNMQLAIDNFGMDGKRKYAIGNRQYAIGNF